MFTSSDNRKPVSLVGSRKTLCTFHNTLAHKFLRCLLFLRASSHPNQNCRPTYSLIYISLKNPKHSVWLWDCSALSSGWPTLLCRSVPRMYSAASTPTQPIPHRNYCTVHMLSQEEWPRACRTGASPSSNLYAAKINLALNPCTWDRSSINYVKTAACFKKKPHQCSDSECDFVRRGSPISLSNTVRRCKMGLGGWGWVQRWQSCTN